MRLEDRLRSDLREATESASIPDDLWARVQGGVASRRHRSRVVRSVAIAAITAAGISVPVAWLAAVGHAPAGPPPSLRSPTVTAHSPTAVAVIPWAPLAAPSPTAATACRFDQVRIEADGWDGLAGGTLVAWVRVVNTSGTPCSLDGAPEVQLIGPGGPLRMHLNRSSRPDRATIVRPGREAIATVFWSEWCGKPIGRLRFRIRLPGQTTWVERRVATQSPGCDPDLPPRSAYGVGDFARGDDVPAGSPLARLRVRVHVTSRIVPGRPLGYVVEVHNPTSRAIALEPCPEYREVLYVAIPEIRRVYLLNCAALHGPIGPGESLTFAMVIPVAPDERAPAKGFPAPGAKAGEAELEWDLAGEGGPTDTATVRFARS